MNHLPLLIYPVLLAILVFRGAVLSPKGQFSKDHMLPGQTRMLQGAACVGIIFHHITQQITAYGIVSKGPVTVFNDVGFLLTGLFFFCSGYGLLVSYDTKPGYLQTFLQKRLPAVLVPFWTVNLFGVLLSRFGYGIRFSLSDTLRKIFGITLINSNGWYIVEIVLFYLLFYLLFSLIRRRDIALSLLCIAVLLLVRYSFYQGHDPEGDQSHWFRGEWWYNSTIAFPAGLLYARFRSGCDRFLQKHCRFLLPAVTLLFAAAFRLSVCTVRRYGYYHETAFHGLRDARWTLLSQYAACLLFLLLILLLGMKIRLGNRALRYLGDIRAELFLIHGFFVHRIFGAVQMPEFYRFLVVTGSSIACTALLAPGIHRLTGLVTSLLLRPKFTNNTLERRIAEQKKKKRRKTLAIAAALFSLLVAALFLKAYGNRLFFAEHQFRQEYEALLAASEGDEVYWGYYEMDRSRLGEERLPWIVIHREEDRVCLLSRYGIAGSAYNQKHEAVSWEESDLRAVLNSDSSLQCFSRYEAEKILPLAGDTITLLTAAEASAFFSTDEERQLVITEAARQDGTNINTMSKHHRCCSITYS